jgi:uncharacterized protein YjgD (DUF1641 family)
MPEPVTLTTAAIATLILTKAFEKTGEKVTEAVWKQGEKLLALLKRKAPETAGAIEKAAQNPQLAEQQPAEFGVLVEQVEKAAIDPDVQAALEELARMAQAQNPVVIENWKGINIKGGVNTVSGNTLNF